MNAFRKAWAPVLTSISLCIASPAAVLAHGPGQPTPGQERAAPRETVRTAFDRPIPNLPGKSIVGLIVTYPPGGRTPAHIHPRSAFVNGFVISGAIRSQVDDGEARVYTSGESWSEHPGAHHGVSENASDTEPAALLAIFVVDTHDKELVTVVGQ